MVVLNDNQMSISQNVGALRLSLQIEIQSKVYMVKKRDDSVLRRIPRIGAYFADLIEKFKNSFKYLVISGMLFEQMGFTYIGPIDGHNMPALIDVMKRAARIGGPVLIHVITKKGKDYFFAEEKPELFHGVPPFNVETGEVYGADEETYSNAFGKIWLKWQTGIQELWL